MAIVPAWLLIAVADGQWKIPDGSLGLALLLVGVALSLWSPGAPAAGAAPPAAVVPGAGDPRGAGAGAPRRARPWASSRSGRRS